MKNKIFSILLICILLIPLITIAPKITADDVKPVATEEDIIDMIQQINESLVYYYHDQLMQFGPRYTGTDACELAGQYIFDEFNQMGLDVEFHEWKLKGFQSRNIIATMPGVDLSSNAIFIYSAHYDCTPGSLGADDDASGVAAVMAAAKIMSQYSFNHTIRFIAFSGEEVGTLGSYCYAKDAYFQGDNIVAVLNADMIGYANTTTGGNIIRFFTIQRSKWVSEFAKEIGNKYYDIIEMSVESLPNYIGSDHQAFLYYGFDSVWIAHHDGYPWGNTPEDTPDRLNWTYEVKATKFLLIVLAEFAIKPIDIQVIFKTPYEGYIYLLEKPIMKSPGGRFWGKETRGVTYIFGRAVVSAQVFSNEEVDTVVFCIDDNFMSWDSNPPYEWKIEGKHKPLRGKHKLSVYAFSESGKMSYDEMDIIIFTRSYQYQKRIFQK